MKKLLAMIILVMFVVVGCSNNEIQKIKLNEISEGNLKIHKNGTLIKDIDYKKNEKLFKKAVGIYNNSKFLSVEVDENEVNLDPISTDGLLEEKYSASYFDIQSKGDTYYIGYKGENVFKVIASGDSYKESPKEYYIENKDLKELIIDNE